MKGDESKMGRFKYSVCGEKFDRKEGDMKHCKTEKNKIKKKKNKGNSP